MSEQPHGIRNCHQGIGTKTERMKSFIYISPGNTGTKRPNYEPAVARDENSAKRMKKLNTTKSRTGVTSGNHAAGSQQGQLGAVTFLTNVWGVDAVLNHDPPENMVSTGPGSSLTSWFEKFAMQ